MKRRELRVWVDGNDVTFEVWDLRRYYKKKKRHEIKKKVFTHKTNLASLERIKIALIRKWRIAKGDVHVKEVSLPSDPPIDLSDDYELYTSTAGQPDRSTTVLSGEDQDADGV